MATLKDTPFIAYDFSEEEYPLAVVFADLQEMHIRTELAVVASKKMVLEVDPSNPEKFRLEHEYYRGQMEILSYLLQLSDGHKIEANAQYQRMVDAQREGLTNGSDGSN